MSATNLKQQTKKGLYWKFAEQFSDYGLQFLIGIAMARMLSPEDYGITALPAVFMAIAGVFIGGGGFGQALIRKPEITEKDLSTAFYYSLGVGIFFYAVLFSVSPWIADFYRTPVLKPLMRVTALSFIYSAIRTPQNIILSRNLNFKTPSKIAVVTKIISGLVGITLAYTGFGVWALVISGLVSGVLGSIMTWGVVRWVPKASWSNESFLYLWNYGNKMMGSWLISTIYANIAPVIIGKFFSPTQLGLYNRAQGYANLPSSNITGTLQAVTFPVLSKMQDNPERLASNYRRIIRVTGFIVFPLMMLLASLAKPFILVMITAKWEACIILLQLMCFNMMWYPIHSINLNLLQVMGRTDLYFNLEVVKKIVGLAIMICSLPLGLVAFTTSGIFFSVLCLVINTYYTKKLIKVSFFNQIKDLSKSLILSFIMFTLVLSFIQLINNDILKLILGSIFGITVYTGGAKLFKCEELAEVKYFLKK